ncbi:MAG: hypothetical protein JWM71_389, partial [Solirubrobacteraceae bacterium]|nr:hypothetical protein [Solirubrobacteraceae bacterium]
MRILLSDGSGLTARQTATQAAAAGHHVEVVSPTRLGAAAFTRHVRRVHRVPAFGRDPFGWLETTLGILRRGRHDVLLPTQEQVALLAREAGAVRATGAGLAVPSFAALLRVQDKVAQARTVAELGLAHPPTWVAGTREALLADTRAPVFLKAPVGTASHGVRRVAAGGDLEAALAAVGGLPVVVQAPASGPLAMIQAVFDEGRMVAWHACLRTTEGAGGGAAVKRSVSLPGVAEDLRRLGSGLPWHGALSLDAILTPAGPSYIDVNPRLVEPGNAWRAGVDLVSPLLAISRGEHPPPVGECRVGVRTRQTLIGVLGAAQRTGSRRAVALELAQALAGRGPYAGTTEELTPTRG